MRTAVLHVVLPLMLLSILKAGMPVQAQEVRETQVPIDAEGRMIELTAEQDQQARVFTDVRDFVLARMFMRDDSTYVLEIESRVDGRLTRSRRTLAAGEAVALRERVSREVRRNAPELALNQEGRSALVTGTTTLSLAFYGWAVPDALRLEDEIAVGTYFMIGGGGFLIPYLATRESEVTNGMASLALHGGARGIMDGFLLAWLLEGDDDFEMRSFTALGTVMSVGEMIAGYHIARVNELSSGHASVLGTTGAFGAGMGLAAYGMFDIRSESPAGPLFGLGGSALGYIVGNAMARNQDYTAGDAAVLTSAGLLGAFVPLLFEAGIEVEDGKVILGSMIAGSAAGLWLGHEAVRGRNFSTSQGNYIGLATTGGALMGFGLGMMMNQEEPNQAVIGAALGGVAGFMLMYHSFEDLARTAPSLGGIHLSISPMGLAGALLPSMQHMRTPLPLVQMSMRF